jgi:hypothetical protein
VKVIWSTRSLTPIVRATLMCGLTLTRSIFLTLCSC